MVTLKFKKPVDSTPSGVDGVVLTFPFQVIHLGAGAMHDQVEEYAISVAISGTLSAMWGFENYHEDPLGLAPTLFQYAKEEATQRLIAGTLEEEGKDEGGRVSLRSGEAPEQNPFDPAKLEDPAGATYKLDLEQERHPREGQGGGSPMGFQFPDKGDES